MNTQISVPIETALFLELVDFLRSHNDPRDPVEVIANHAIYYWMENADWKPELLETIKSDSRGYFWKTLFLPNGTEIRMFYKSKNYYARVEGDEIIYEGESVSPGNLANTIAKSSRNAWRDLWIKRPNDKEWKLADDLRKDDPLLAF